MPRSLTIVPGLVVLAASLGMASFVHAQTSDPAAVQEVHKAVAAELDASKTDKSIWMYQERDTTSDKNALYDTVETSQGTLKRLIELNGRTLTGKAQQIELQRVENYVHDTAAQARARRSGAHDDAQTTEMLKMLPDAFIWTRVGQTADSETLKYRPNPDFHPPNMQARVMSIMAGEMILVLPGHRIRTLRGALADDVRFGFGILGKLDRGGTFDVERRMVGDGRWQITETRVHIGGRALLFKNIGQQEDDIKTNWRPSPAHTLEEAAQILTTNRPDHP